MILTRIIPGSIAAVGITLCQFHGGPFWVWLMGSAWIGWTLSGLWEAMSVWMWWDGSYRKLKYVPTLFLLFGMIYQSSTPILEQAGTLQNTNAIREKAQETVDDMRKVIVEQERKGWQHMLEGALAITMKRTDGTLAPVLYVVSIIPLIGFPALYGICLLFVGGLRVPVPVIPRRSNPTEQLAERCKTAIEAKLAGGMSYRDIATETGVSTTGLQGVVHRERNRNEGKPIVQHAALERCAIAIGV